MFQTVSIANGIPFFGDTRVIETLLLRLKQLLEQEEDKSLQETLLLAFGRIGCVADGEHLLCILIQLIQHFHENAGEKLGLAFEQISLVAASKGKRTKDLLLQVAIHRTFSKVFRKTTKPRFA
jgi:hypothetical protein